MECKTSNLAKPLYAELMEAKYFPGEFIPRRFRLRSHRRSAAKTRKNSREIPGERINRRSDRECDSTRTMSTATVLTEFNTNSI